MSVEILPWHRRHAIQIAAALPETSEDALLVLDLARKLVEGFLSGEKPDPAKVLSIVRDQT
jgi:hypothetical protein